MAAALAVTALPARVASAAPPAGGSGTVTLQVPGTFQFSQIKAEIQSTIALATDGSVWAWGVGGDGQLGNGTTNNSSTPVKVAIPGGRTATAVDAGEYHMLALASDGTLWTWGANNFAQLGNGTRTKATTPIQVTVTGGLRFVQMSATGFGAVALATDGSVWTWGSNADATIGDGTTTDALTPYHVVLPAGHTVARVVGGLGEVMVLNTDGTAYGWGDAGSGELCTGGANPPVHYTVPTAIPAFTATAFTNVSLGNGNTFLVDSAGKVWACGSNQDGALGDGTVGGADATSPQLVRTPAGKDFVQVAAGDQTGLAVASDGTVWAWGDNAQGQLGDGTTIASSVPVQVHFAAGTRVTQVGSQADHFVAVDSSGLAYGWSVNTYGQIGNGNTTDSKVPVPVSLPAIGAVSAVSAGGVAASNVVFTPSSAGDDSGTVTFTAPTGWSASDPIVVTRALGSQTFPGSFIPTVSSIPPGTAVVGQAYSYTPTASGDGPITYALSSGSLPAGLGLDASTGAIAGSPTASGSASFTVTASGPNGSSLYPYTISVGEATHTTSSAPPVTLGQIYSYTPTTSGTGAITYAVTSGTLPTGLTLDPSTGAIAGTPTSGTSFTVTASTTYSSEPQTFRVGSSPTVGAVPPSGTIARVGKAYTYTPDVSGTGPFTYATSGLPDGLSLNPNSGVISGTPTTAGTYAFTLTVATPFGTSAQTITLNIAAADSSSLAFTGMDEALTDGLIAAAAGLVLVGAAAIILVGVRRRRLR